MRIEFETGMPQRVEQHRMAAPFVERDVEPARIERGGLVRYGGCNERGAGFRDSKPQAVMRADLGADVGDDVASAVENRRGGAAVLRVAGCELATELLFPCTGVLGGGGRGHGDSGNTEEARSVLLCTMASRSAQGGEGALAGGGQKRKTALFDLRKR